MIDPRWLCSNTTEHAAVERDVGVGAAGDRQRRRIRLRRHRSTGLPSGTVYPALSRLEREATSVVLGGRGRAHREGVPHAATTALPRRGPRARRGGRRIYRSLIRRARPSGREVSAILRRARSVCCDLFGRPRRWFRRHLAATGCASGRAEIALPAARPPDAGRLRVTRGSLAVAPGALAPRGLASLGSLEARDAAAGPQVRCSHAGEESRASQRSRFSHSRSASAPTPRSSAPCARCCCDRSRFRRPSSSFRSSRRRDRAPDAVGGSASPPDFMDWRTSSTVVRRDGRHQRRSLRLDRHAGPRSRFRVRSVTGGFFNVLGVPALSAAPATDDDAIGGPDVVVLAHASVVAALRRRSRRLSGRTMTIDGSRDASSA